MQEKEIETKRSVTAFWFLNDKKESSEYLFKVTKDKTTYVFLNFDLQI
jgi:hypothetical protein